MENIFVGRLVMVFTFFCGICNGYLDTKFVMVKGGLDENTTAQLLNDFLGNRSIPLKRGQNESTFCSKKEDEKAAICALVLGLEAVRNIVQADYNLQAHPNPFNLTSYQCRIRKLREMKAKLISNIMPDYKAKFIRCPTTFSTIEQLKKSDLYVTIDHNGGYYLFGSPWGDNYLQPIAHIEKQFPIRTYSRQSSPVTT